MYGLSVQRWKKEKKENDRRFEDQRFKDQCFNEANRTHAIPTKTSSCDERKPIAIPPLPPSVILLLPGLEASHSIDSDGMEANVTQKCGKH